MPPDTQDSKHPPEPGRTRRRLRFGPLQGAVLAVLIAVPILALAGVFGVTWETEEANTSDLHVRLRHVERFRYKQIGTIDVYVRNRSDRTIDTVTVAVDTSYVLRFSDPSFIPSAEQAFRVPLTDVRPGELRVVTAKIQAEAAGRHNGTVAVYPITGDTARIEVSTLVFP